MVGKEKLRSVMERLEPAGHGFYYPDGDQDAFWRIVRTTPDYADLVSEIRREGERLSATPIPELTYALFTLFEKQGSRLEYERVYFERRRRLNTFVLLSLLEPERDELRSGLHEIIWAVCNEYTWCLPAHLQGRKVRGAIDLFAAETGFALSEIAVLLGQRLPARLRDRMAEEVEQRLFRPFLENGPFGWETAKHNWSAVCAGSIGAAALLMLDPSDRLTAVISKALDSMAYFLDGFGDDGACTEGIGYWNYGFGFFVYFADLLKRRTGGAIDLFRLEKVRSIALFQQKCYLDGDAVVNFSDSPLRVPVQLGLTHYLAGLYPEDMDVPPSSLRAAYTEDHCSRWAPAFRNLIWYDAGKRETAWRAADYYLPDAEWTVSRHHSEYGRFGFAAKGGHNDEPHNHNDIGQFILLAGGTPFITDLGAGEYTAEYFGPGRYDFDCNGSQGHTVPILDGRLQAAGRDSAARILEASLGKDEVRFKLEFGSAYRLGHLASAVRQFVWRKAELPSLELIDEFKFTSVPERIVERLATVVPPEPGEGCILLRGEDGYAVKIVYDRDKLEPVFTSRTFTDHFGRETPWYTIDFSLRRKALFNRIVLRFDIVVLTASPSSSPSSSLSSESR